MSKLETKKSVEGALVHILQCVSNMNEDQLLSLAEQLLKINNVGLWR